MPRAIVFDDGDGSLAPLTGLRPAFDVRTGGLTTLERLGRVLQGPLSLRVPEPLAALAREVHGPRVNEPPAPGDAVLLVNGRAPLACEITTALGPGHAVRDAAGVLIAAHLPAARAEAALRGDLSGLQVRRLDGLQVLSRPWHVRLLRDRSLAFDLALLTRSGSSAAPPGAVAFGTHPLRIDSSARVYPGATLDLEHGPIFIDEEAVIRPGAVVIGPAYVGRHATVMDRAVIRPQTAIGPHCKIGGEVGGTIFQGYSNKAHDGYLGDSWVGEWVNLGAATNNSNLLNTYGEVKCRATPDGPEEAAGERFVGAFIGDHVKTAIATRIMTGAVIHTGAMLAPTAPVTGAVPPFAWSTDGGVSTWRFDRFLETARAMMGRRGVQPSAAYLARLRDLHERRSP